MPQLYKRGEVWWAWGYDSNGKRWYQSTKQRDKSAARRVGRQIELERSLPPDVPALPLGEALRMLEEHKTRMRRSAATMDIFHCKAGHLVRVFGEQRDLTKLTLADAEHYVDRRRDEGVTDHTIAKEVGILRSSLRHAARHGRYTADPKGIWPSALEDVYTPRDRWLTVPEYRALLSELTAYRQEYVIAYCNLGLRYSELYRIESRHLDYAQQGVRVDGTKTEGAHRWIPCSEDVWAVLTQRAEQYSEGPLFPGRWYRSRMGQDLKAACEDAGIARVSANDLRRTFASWLCNRGVPELVTIRLMGHKSSVMVRRVYAQLAPETLRDAVSRLPSAVTGPVTDGAPE